MNDIVNTIVDTNEARQQSERVPTFGDDVILKGCALSLDTTTDTLSVSAGTFITTHNGQVYIVDVLPRTDSDAIDVPADSQLGVYYDIDPNQIVVQASAPSAPMLQLGTIDTAAGTVDNTINRDPDVTNGSTITDELTLGGVSKTSWPSGGVGELASDHINDSGVSNGGDAIQAAVDSLPAGGGTVIVDPEPPDSYTDGGGTTHDNIWLFDNAVTYGDNITIIIHATPGGSPDGVTCLMADSVQDNFFRNKTAGDGTTNRNSNIHIKGVGMPFLDQNPENASYSGQTPDHGAIKHHKVDNLSVSGLRLKSMGPACMPEDINQGSNNAVAHYENLIHDGTPTADVFGVGFHGNGPLRRVRLNGFSFIGDDDAVIFTAAEGDWSYGGGGNLHNVAVTNTYANQLGTGVMWRVQGDSTGGSARISNISFSNGTYETDTDFLAKIGLNADAGNPDLYENISITNATGQGQGVTLRSPVSNISVSDINTHYLVFDDGGYQVDNLLMHNCQTRTENRALLFRGTVTGSKFSNIHSHTTDANEAGIVVRTAATLDDVEFHQCRFEDHAHIITVESGATLNNRVILRDVVGRTLSGAAYNLNEPGVFVDNDEHLPGVGNGSTQNLNGGTPVDNIVTIRDTTNGHVATFLLQNGRADEVSDPTNNFGTTSGSGNLHDVVWDSTNSDHQIENASGTSVDYEVTYGSLG